MSSAQLSALTSLQQSDYVSLAILTAVAYDYLLTFPSEIEYIWNKPWSWVSTLFIFVRYLGLLNVITCSLLGSSFLPGPAKTYVFVLCTSSGFPNLADHDIHTWHALNSCEIIYTIDTWVFDLFLGAADFVMMLRVWAMYNRSGLILGVLLAIFSLEIISSIIGAAVNSDPKNLSAPTVQILNVSFCLVISTPVWTNQATVLQMTHGAVMCLLAIVQFVRQSFQMYCVTKQWQPSHYMSLLVKQGILYFFAIFLFNLMNVLSESGKFPTGGWQMILLLILNYVPVFTLTPRFILSIRELYARDVQRRYGEGIDTGFGLSSTSGDASGTPIVFADIEQNGGSEDIEGVRTTEGV